MKSWQWTVLCLASLAAAGCRVSPTVARLERENRELEDRMYELAGLLDDCSWENANLREQLDEGESPAQRPAEPEPRLPVLRPPQTSRQDQPEPPRPPTEFEPPTVEVPDVEMPGEEFLERIRRREGPALPGTLPAPTNPEPPKGILPLEEGRSTPSEPRISRRADSSEVELITLNERFTGGYNQDGRVGHEGVITVIEPRDAQGRLVDAPASVSVAVLDPLLSGNAARIARWDFAEQEVAALYRETPLSAGIHLEMVWPGALPIHRELAMFVRYTTRDGRKLQVEKIIDIEVPALEAQRPLPADSAQAPARVGHKPVRWQGKPRPLVHFPEAKPARTALAPAEPVARPRPISRSSPQPDPPKTQRPAWSPDRR